MNEFSFTVNTNFIEGCSIDCLACKLLCANRFGDSNASKIILDSLEDRFKNKTHENDKDILDFQIENHNTYKIYKFTLMFNGDLTTIETIL